RNLVVTLGQDGCLYCGPQGRLHEPAYPVEARGPMVAAEVFDGALALCLARGKSLREALQFASAAAAVCATGPGAQPSISWREKVEACLASSLSARNKRSE
ncbi:MAG: PfkB family carbohydrate kinase, partial [candidate division KSB1 bacterium]|nr:PfkB family carbohydrate kinase [candidate division KSB1 bacterium]